VVVKEAALEAMEAMEATEAMEVMEDGEATVEAGVAAREVAGTDVVK